MARDRTRQGLGRGVATAFCAVAALATVSPGARAEPVPAGTITTMAGGPGAGPASEVAQEPRAIAVAGTTLYVLDVDPEVPPLGYPYSAVVRAVNLTTGEETAVAGTGDVSGGFAGDGGDARLAVFANPTDIAADGAGNVYVADWANNRIRRINAQGIITTIVGGPNRGFSGDGGQATGALVDGPSSVAVDSAGRVFFFDSNNIRVRRIDLDGVITTVAGTGTAGSTGDGGPAVNADISDVRHMAIDVNGVLYLPELVPGRIRRVAAGIITTMTTATGAFSVAIGDTPGSLFAVTGANNLLRVAADGTTSVVAGADDSGYVDGTVADARFFNLRSVTGHGGTVYVGDYRNRRVRRISAGMVTTIAGNGTVHDGGDGRSALDAQFDRPRDLVALADGSLVVNDGANNRLRVVRPDGTIAAFAGTAATGFSGDGGPATAATFGSVESMAAAPDGSLLVSDYGNSRIRRISPAGTMSTIAGTGQPVSSGDGGPATAAGVRPGALGVDGATGRIFFRDASGPIRVIAPDGTISTFWDTTGDAFAEGVPYDDATPGAVLGIVVQADGIYLADHESRVRRIDPCGRLSTVARFSSRIGALTADPAGNLFVTRAGPISDHYPPTHHVTELAVDGTVSTVAGAGPSGLAGDGGPAPSALLDTPLGLAVLPGGDLAIADTYNYRIRRVAAVAAVTGNGGTRPCWTPPPPPSPGPAPTPPSPTPTSPTPATPTPTPPRSGYWMVTGAGSVYAFGDAPYLGPGPAGAVDIEATPAGDGYWMVDSRGSVWARGNARYFGGAGNGLAAGEAVTSLSATPGGGGYWLFTSLGRALPFGDAAFFGDMRGTRLNGPVLDSIPTPTGRGYYMVASDGGIFAFGDARFRGSMGGTRLNAPVQSLVPSADGYWLVASDGGVFAFNAPFRGSMGGTRLNSPVTGMVPFGTGYLMVGEDGGIFNFSDKPFVGSLGANPPPSPVIAVAALRS